MSSRWLTLLAGALLLALGTLTLGTGPLRLAWRAHGTPMLAPSFLHAEWWFELSDHPARAWNLGKEGEQQAHGVDLPKWGSVQLPPHPCSPRAEPWPNRR